MRVVFHGCRSSAWQVAVVNLPMKESFLLTFCTQTRTTPLACFLRIGDRFVCSRCSIYAFTGMYHVSQVHMLKRRSEGTSMDQYAYSDDVKYEEEFIVNSRGNKLFTCGWTPRNLEPKALIFICHGIAAECSVSMRDTASRLVRAGYAVYAIDHEGHGRSSGLRCYIPDFSDVVGDCSSYFTSVCDRPENREKKRFLYGISMGGSVALLLHRKDPAYWDGAVLLAPMCKISDDMKPHPVVVSVLKLVCAVAPSWRIIPTPDILDKVCKDPEMRKQVRSNPYIYRGKIPLKTCHELLMVSLDIEKNLHEVTLPFLVLHGGDDIVTDPSVSKLLFEEASSGDKAFKLYPGMWHALSAELPPDAERVYSDIISWLDQRANRATCAANLSVNLDTASA